MGGLAEAMRDSDYRHPINGVYWIRGYTTFREAGLEVYLVNARETKNLPGRKSDVQESHGLMKLHTYGLLRTRFGRRKEVRTMRHTGDSAMI